MESNSHGNRTGRSLNQWTGLLIAGAILALAAVAYWRGSRPASRPASTHDEATPSPPGSTSTTNPGVATVLDPGLARLIRAMNNSSLSLPERKQAILALARDGSPAALAALKEALAHSSSPVRQAIAESLGQCPAPEGLAMLIALLKDSDQAVAKAAVHGLAQQDQAGAGTALSQLLNDASAAPGVRCEAALALGDIKQPWVLDPLSRAAREAHDANVAKAALDAIGKLDFSDTRGFFQDYIQSANTSSELRVDAIDAVAASQGDPNSFLAQLAANHDLDSEARAEAAWAMSATDVTGNNGAQLLAMLQNETDPDVRLRLYQALNNQDSFDTAAALAMVQKENDPTAIAVGLETLAKALAMNGNDPQLQSYFDQTGINQLKQLALNTPDLDTRQKAVIALTALAAAHNPAAVDALNALHQQLDPKSTQAGSSASSHSTRPPGNPSPSPGP